MWYINTCGSTSLRIQVLVIVDVLINIVSAKFSAKVKKKKEKERGNLMVFYFILWNEKIPATSVLIRYKLLNDEYSKKFVLGREMEWYL